MRPPELGGRPRHSGASGGAGPPRRGRRTPPHARRRATRAATQELRQTLAATLAELRRAQAEEAVGEDFPDAPRLIDRERCSPHGESVAPGTLGRVASYYYVDYRTTRDAAGARVLFLYGA